MKKKLFWIIALLLVFSLNSCKEKSTESNNNTTNSEKQDENDNVEGVTLGGKYGTDEPDANTFVFNATRLEKPIEDYEYLNIGTYGTNNFFQMGGDIRIRMNDEGTKVNGLEVEKNTLGWIKFTVNKPQVVSFNISSTSSENTSKVVLVNAETKIKQTLQSTYTDIKLLDDNTIASVKGTSYCKVTASIEIGTYILRSPVINDKTDPAYRKNFKLLSITVGDQVSEDERVFLSADTLQQATYTQNIQLFSGTWGSINATADKIKSIIIDQNNKTFEEYSFGTRIKTCGKMEGDLSKNTRAIIITLKKKTEITMYAMSSSKDTSRTVNIYAEDFSTPIYNITNVLGSSLYTYSFTLEAGTYYLSTTTGGLNIYAFQLDIK